jgi:hypothetical protein
MRRADEDEERRGHHEHAVDVPAAGTGAGCGSPFTARRAAARISPAISPTVVPTEGCGAKGPPKTWSMASRSASAPAPIASDPIRGRPKALRVGHVRLPFPSPVP